MKMLYSCGLLSILLILTGCSKDLIINGKSSKKIDVAQTKIETVDNNINKLTNKKLDIIGEFSHGVNYALTVNTNKTVETDIAQNLNKRIASLSTTPDIEQIKSIETIVEGLRSNSAFAVKQLNIKDGYIKELVDNQKVLALEKQNAIDKYFDLSKQVAGQSDTYKQSLSEMDSWLGLGAVKYGLLKFIKSSLWILGISGILFILLRIFAASNPIAGAVFSIFSVIAGYAIKVIAWIVPKGIEFSGNIATSAYNSSKTLLTKIVDSMQFIKNIEKQTGKPATVKQLLNELEKNLDKSEKEVIDKLKRDLGY